MIDWKDVNEELPKDCGEVLVRTNSESLRKAKYKKKKQWFFGCCYECTNHFEVYGGRFDKDRMKDFQEMDILGKEYRFANISFKDEEIEYITHWAYINEPEEK